MKLPNELITDMKLMTSILDRSSGTCFILLGSKISTDEIWAAHDTDVINEEALKDKLACRDLSNLLSRIQISDEDPIGITTVDDLISRSPARSNVSYKKTSRQNLQPYPSADPQRLSAIKTQDCFLSATLLAQDADSCELPLSVLEHLEDTTSNCDVLQEPEFIEQFKKHVEHLESSDLLGALEFSLPVIKIESKNFINLSNSTAKTKAPLATRASDAISDVTAVLTGTALSQADSQYLSTSLNIPLSTVHPSGSDGEECNSADTWALSSVTNKVSSSPSSWCSTLSTSPSRHSAAYLSPSWGSTADPSPSSCEPVSSPPLNIFASFTTSTSSYLENSPILNSPHSSSSSPPTSILSPRSSVLPPLMNGTHPEPLAEYEAGYAVRNKIHAASNSNTTVDFLCLNDNTIFTSSNSEKVMTENGKHHQNFYPETKSIPAPCTSNLPLNIYGSPCPPPPHANVVSPQPFNKLTKSSYSNNEVAIKSPVLLELTEKDSSECPANNNNNNINVHNNNTKSCSRSSDPKFSKKKPNRAEPTFLEIQPDGPVVRDEDMVVPGRLRIEKMLHRILQIAAIAETFSKNPASIFSVLIGHLTTYEPKRERGKLEKIYACVERLKKKDLSHLFEEFDSNGMSLLYYAALECHKFPVIPRYIADSTVEVNGNPDQRFTPENNSLLHILAGLGGSYSNVLAELLNVRNVLHVPVFDINKQNSSAGHTPLHSAVLAHHPPLLNSVTAVKILVKYGANLDAQDHNGRRPLHLAIMSSCDPVLIKILLQKGSADTVASVNSVDLNGDTPLHLVAGKNDLPVSVQKEVIKQLTDKGAVSKSNLHGNLPVHFLSFDRKQELQALLQRKK